VWTLQHEGHRHRVAAGGSLAHEVRWYVDDELLAEKKTWDDNVTVEAADRTLRVVYSGLAAGRARDRRAGRAGLSLPFRPRRAGGLSAGGRPLPVWVMLGT
jgi:hypothetical protein